LEIGYRGIGYTDGSKKDTAVVAEFIPALNKFVIRIPERVDTVLIRDTIRVKPTDIILRGDDNTERLIWIISFTLTTIFIIIYKRYLNVRKSLKNKLEYYKITNFTIDEITMGRNIPEQLLWNILPTIRVLQELRSKYDKPIFINSSYRSPAYNKLVRGKKKSLHLDFNAIDFTVVIKKI
jgi:hypothetical protein